MQCTRRQALGAMSVPVVAGVGPAMLDGGRLAAVLASAPPPVAGDLDPDEDFWFEVGRAFTVDRSLVNLNNGGVSPSPAFVQEAMKRHLDYSNTAPPYTMWRVLEPQREAVRQRLTTPLPEPGSRTRLPLVMPARRASSRTSPSRTGLSVVPRAKLSKASLNAAS